MKEVNALTDCFIERLTIHFIETSNRIVLLIDHADTFIVSLCCRMRIEQYRTHGQLRYTRTYTWLNTNSWGRTQRETPFVTFFFF